MIVYANTPAKRTRQITADVAVGLWAVLWIRVGKYLYDALQLLTEPGRRLADAGSSLSSNLRAAGDTVSGIPLVGNRVRDPFDRASGAGSTLRDAGLTQIDAVETVALVLSLIVATIPISIVVLPWLRSRVRFVRRAQAVTELLATSPGAADLLALRALTSRPPALVMTACPDAAARWRAGDETAVRELAQLELRTVGLTGVFPSGRPR
ncbi:hypothetical protein R4172_17760 [Rhodococcus kroppenstedtii]|uniref:Unannotated protein n=1 Tax=freshwater metagenome TaxID=449393 RepID=A0A6J7I3T0_9ZZZZ|nr:hypothetical protein [Rhodococcus kroppenstedtii]MDV7199394.1 hypothetical protein [Rhodococcus kroppenstedtii]MSX08290.1 hypothetical protein [Actinomycetota bacterium]